MEKSTLKRKFILERAGKKTSLSDPNPSMSPDEVQSFYSDTYPELVTCNVNGPVYEGDSIVYTFKTTVGTKG